MAKQELYTGEVVESPVDMQEKVMWLAMEDIAWRLLKAFPEKAQEILASEEAMGWIANLVNDSGLSGWADMVDDCILDYLHEKENQNGSC